MAISSDTKEDNINIDVEAETQKLNALNKMFDWIEDKKTKAILVNKYYNNKEHRDALRVFLDDMIKALDESTGTTVQASSGKEQTKKQLSYVT